MTTILLCRTSGRLIAVAGPRSPSRPKSSDPLVQLAPVVTTDPRLDDLDAAVGAGECLLELGQRVHPEVGSAGGGAQ
jgi:hypothetical protein